MSDAGELMHGVFGIGSLKLPIDLTRQGYATLLHLDLDAIGGKPDLPFQDVDRARRDLVIGTLCVEGRRPSISSADMLQLRQAVGPAPISSRIGEGSPVSAIVLVQISPANRCTRELKAGVSKCH